LNLDSEVEVTLTGGEVTLYPERYIEAVKWFTRLEREIDIKFRYAVVSNGTNIDIILDWINKKILESKRTAISWDGIYSESKSRQSKNSKFSDLFFNNVIKKIGSSKYNKYIYISHAITPFTIKYLYDSFKFAIDNGIKNIGFYYIHEANYNDRNFVSSFRENIEKIASLFVSCYKNIETRFTYYNWQMIYSKKNMKQLDIIKSTKCHKLGRVLHIDQFGDIYPCVYFGDHRAMCIGNVKDGFLKRDVIASFLNQYSEKPLCNYNECNNFHCFECPASCYVHNGHMMKRFSNLCELLTIEKDIYDRYIKLLDINKLDEKYFWNEIEHETKTYENRLSSVDSVKLPFGECYLDNKNLTLSNNYEMVRSWLKDFQSI